MPKTEPFEKHPYLYEKWFKRHRWAYESEINAVKEHLPKKGKAVEIGAGSGRFAKPLGIKTGVEPSEEMARIARQKGIDVIKGIAEDLPLKDGAFDYALMTTTICFVDDVDKAFEEVRRILKPEGRFIVGFIDRDSPIGKVYQKHKNESIFYRAATFFSTEEVLQRLKKAGFVNPRITQTLFNPLKEIKSVEPAKDGHGEGSFIVISVFKHS